MEPPDDDTFRLRDGSTISLLYAERVAIAVEAGVPLQEAMRIAAAEEQQRGRGGGYVPGQR